MIYMIHDNYDNIHLFLLASIDSGMLRAPGPRAGRAGTAVDLKPRRQVEDWSESSDQEIWLSGTLGHTQLVVYSK